MRQFKIFHPFLFAIFPVLFLFAYNIDEVNVSDLLLPMIAVTVSALVLLLSLRLVVKSYNKIGVIVSFVMVWFFSYGYLDGFWQHLEGTFLWWRPTLVTLLLWLLALVAVVFFVKRVRRDFPTFTKFLNFTAVILVSISLVNIGVFSIKATNLNLVPEEISEGSIRLDDRYNLPDIYYVILDRYARADTLEEFHSYDNSDFIDHLTDKGFYVATKSRTNYPITPSAVASALNMEYINYLSDTVGEETKDLHALFQIIKKNKVAQCLRDEGYRYVFISTGFGPPDQRDTYTEVFKNRGRFGLTKFSSFLFQMTPLRPVANHFIQEDYRSRVLFGFDALANMPNYYKEPVFVFAHISCPHPPFLFDRYGNLPEGEGTYVEQVMFTNKKVEAVVDEILSKSRVPPVIILQGDTGHGGPRFNILNAYLLPGKGNDLLYESITPVNSFRVVLNLYFDAEYELLKDESYETSYALPYKFDIIPPEGDAD